MTSLDGYFNSLRERLAQFRETKCLAERPTASAFSVFPYIRPDENRLSDILADLLNPFGPHAQGSLFVRRFFEHAGIDFDLPADALDRVRVRREALTTHLLADRRIDVTLEVGRFAVGIENKPWADDQPDQLPDYEKHLRARYGAGNYVLVYLPGSGLPPPSLSDADRIRLEQEGLLRVLPLGTAVPRWLDACHRDCVAEKVSAFLRDFADYLGATFGGVTMSDDAETAEYISHALASPENLEVALGYLAHAEGIRAGIRDAVVGPFIAALVARVSEDLAGRGEGWSANRGEPDDAAGWVWVTRANWPGGPNPDRKLRVVLTYTGDAPYWMYFQVRRHVYPDDYAGDSDTFAALVVAAVKDACGKGRVSNYWWPGWYKPADEYLRWSDKDVLAALHHRAEALDYFAGQLVRLATAVDEAVRSSSGG